MTIVVAPSQAAVWKDGIQREVGGEQEATAERVASAKLGSQWTEDGSFCRKIGTEFPFFPDFEHE